MHSAGFACFIFWKDWNKLLVTICWILSKSAISTVDLMLISSLSVGRTFTL